MSPYQDWDSANVGEFLTRIRPCLGNKIRSPNFFFKIESSLGISKGLVASAERGREQRAKHADPADGEPIAAWRESICQTQFRGDEEASIFAFYLH